MELIPANAFTLQELADAYNETRIDYIIPMPMTVERLRDYIQVSTTSTSLVPVRPPLMTRFSVSVCLVFVPNEPG
jgi:hypothetical protein